MQTENILEKMASLKLAGMADGLREQAENANIGQLSFEERLGIIFGLCGGTPKIMDQYLTTT
jgi:hypothetical protein